jgi:hypothetical protein
MLSALEFGAPQSSRFALEIARGLAPVHRLKARENAAASEKPSQC